MILDKEENSKEQIKEHLVQLEYNHDDDEEDYDFDDNLESSVFIKKLNSDDEEDDTKDHYEEFNITNSSPTNLGRPKHFKQIVLVLCLFSLIIMKAFLFSLFVPTMYSQIIKDKYPNNTVSENKSIASHYKSITDASPFLVVFICGSIVGVLSDRYGRKKIFIGSITLLAIDATCTLISYYSNNLYIFLIAHTICGLQGCTAPTILSYISDITTKEERPKVFAFSGVSIGVAIIVGPLLASLSMQISTPAPLYIVYILVIVGYVIIFFLKESIHLRSEEDKLKAKTTKKTLNPFKSIKKLFTSSGYVAFVTCLFIVYSFISEDIMTTMYFYTEIRYGWGPKENSLNIAFMGGVIIIYSTFVLPIILKYLSDRYVISISFFISGIVHIGIAFAFNQYIWIACGFGIGFASVLLSLTQALISKSTPPEIQGSILTGVASVGALASFLGALITQNVFAYFISSRAPIYFPGAHFLIDSIPIFLACIGSLVIWKFYPESSPSIKTIKSSINK